MRRSLLLFAIVAGLPAAAFAQAGPAGCDTPESHQLDFWVGKWEVHPNGADKIIAHSLIEKKYKGCAVRENWMPVGMEIAGGGGSLSGYDPRDKQWHQTWYDSTGSRVVFDGGFADGVMAITGNWPNVLGPGKDALVKMSYQLQPDGQVRQWGMTSNDGGKTWQPSFDLLYRHIDEFPPFK
jgi:hypothetical protein